MKRKNFFAATILISSLFSSCYQWFEEKVSMTSRSSLFADINYTSIGELPLEESQIVLYPPKQVFASQGLYSDKILVTWAECENATSYSIERAVYENSTPPENLKNLDFEVINEGNDVFSTYYEDVILKKPGIQNEEYGYIYFYRITAKNVAAGYEESEYSEVSVSNGCGWLLKVPSGVEATKGASTEFIIVSWNKIDNASGYKIYKSDKINGLLTEIANVNGNQNKFIDTIEDDNEKGKYLYYKVTATTSHNTESALSSSALGYTLIPGAPSQPEEVKVLNGIADINIGAKGFSISWKEVPMEDNFVSMTYSIYRNSSVDSEFTLIADKIPNSTTEFTDKTGIRPNITYYYYIQAVAFSDLGVELLSPFSDSGNNSKNPAAAFLLSAPPQIEIADGENDSKSMIYWKPALGSADPYSISYTYNIYGCTTMDGDFTLIKNTSGTIAENDMLYEQVDKIAYFKISTVRFDSTDTESQLSNAYAPSPAAPKTVTVSRTEKIATDNWYANSNGVYPVKISWEKPDNETPAAYNVYRSTDKDTGFKKINDEYVTETSFIDYNNTRAKPGIIYYYRVISLNNLYQGTKGTINWGYGAISADYWFREFNKTVMSSQKKLTLMHKKNDLDKVGSERVSGTLSGYLSYKAEVQGLGAEITMHYERYSDFYINGNPELGEYFILTGNTDTTSDMSANGHMHESVICSHSMSSDGRIYGMYPGKADYINLQIKGGKAGGGTYGVTTYDLSGKTVINTTQVDWKVGEEGRK